MSKVGEGPKPYITDQDNLPRRGIVEQDSLSHLCLYNTRQADSHTASIAQDISELLSRITAIISC